MTIKEIEERTGMDRANIRFYEKEGLINPTRLDNGYRDYTQKDIDVLLRIKLLRSLHLSIEDIRALQTTDSFFFLLQRFIDIAFFKTCLFCGSFRRHTYSHSLAHKDLSK